MCLDFIFKLVLYNIFIICNNYLPQAALKRLLTNTPLSNSNATIFVDIYIFQVLKDNLYLFVVDTIK